MNDMIEQHSSLVGADYDIETTTADHNDDTDMSDSDDLDASGMFGHSFSSSSPPQQQHQQQQQQQSPPITSRVQIQFSLPLRKDEDKEDIHIPSKPRTTKDRDNHNNNNNNNGNDVNADDNNTEDAQSITSVTSIPYFDPTDFKPANWDTISDHAPTIGFALFGLAMALTHPVFFMAGLATALGTATAASRGYDCFVDGTCGLGTTSSSATTATTNTIYNSWFGTTMTQQEAAAGVVNPAPLLDKTLVDHPPPAIVLPESEQTAMDSTESNYTPVQQEKGQRQQKHGPSATIPVEKRISSMGSSSTTTTTTDTAEEQQEYDTRKTPTEAVAAAATATQHRRHHHHHHHHSLKRPLPSRDVPILATDKDAMSWWKQQYPSLKNTVIQDQCFVGLNVAEFFRVFFSDHAPYNFQEFQVKRGDRNITYGTWTPMVFDPSLHLQQHEPLSMHPDAKTAAQYRDYHSYQTRTLNFQAKTNNGLLGPAYATTTKIQRWMMVSKRFAVLESKTVLHNIPFCDKFFVMERWYLHATKSNNTNSNGKSNLSSSSYYTTQLTVTAGVYFVDTCPFEMAIRSKSATAIRDVVTAWTAMALQALELTKQAKLDRLSKSCSESSPRHFSIRVGQLHNEDEDDGDDDDVDDNRQDMQGMGDESTDDIEVQYSASSFSSGSNGQSVSLVRSETDPVKKKRSVLVGFRRSLSNMVASTKQKQ